MNIKDVITSVAGGLILFGIVGIYSKMDTMRDDISLVRQELVQYHTIVGFLQKEIEKLSEEIKDEHRSNN